MLLSIITWTLLVVIAVSDAREHRIPNKLLVILLASLCLSTFVQTPESVLWPAFQSEFKAFFIAFAFGLVLYSIKVMAPGDVKLIAVLGFFLGTGELVSYLYYVCLITAFVGSMYWLLNQLYLALKTGANIESKEQVSQISITGMVVGMQLNQQALKKKMVTGNDLTYMPFAPILVMGLALHQYYS